MGISQRTNAILTRATALNQSQPQKPQPLKRPVVVGVGVRWRGNNEIHRGGVEEIQVSRIALMDLCCTPSNGWAEGRAQLKRVLHLFFPSLQGIVRFHLSTDFCLARLTALKRNRNDDRG